MHFVMLIKFAQEEVVYEDLCSFKKAGDDHDETNHLPHPPVSYIRQPKEKRDYCIKELIETEGNYVEVRIPLTFKVDFVLNSLYFRS